MDKKELETLISVKMLEHDRTSQAEMAKAIETTQPNFNRKLKNGSFSYLTVVKIADYLGYDIVWKKKETNE